MLVPWSKNFGNYYGRTFYRPDALPVTQPTASKHWRMTVFLTGHSTLAPCWHDRAEHCDCFKEASVLQRACCHHAVMMSQEHCCGSTIYRPDTLPVTQQTASNQRRLDSSTQHSSQTKLNRWTLLEPASKLARRNSSCWTDVTLWGSSITCSRHCESRDHTCSNLDRPPPTIIFPSLK